MPRPGGDGSGYRYGGPAFPGAIIAGIGILTDDFWGWLFIDSVPDSS